MKNTTRPHPSRKSRGLGIASMVLGILSVVLALIFGGILGIVGLVLGIVALKKGAGRGFAIAGIAASALGIVIGLAYLLVLLSIPALQQNQADTARRNDAGRFMSAVNNYQADNQGELPSPDAVNDFVGQYLEADGQSFADPRGVPYTFVDGTPQALGEMRYGTGVTCSGTGFTAGSSRQAAVIVKLSTGEYCANS